MVYTKKNELTSSAKELLKYYLKGEGSRYHYVTSNGSYSTNNTNIATFKELCDEWVMGNDAPRGGRTGDYIECVKLNETGRRLIKEYIELAESKEKSEKLAEEKRRKAYIETSDKFEKWAKGNFETFQDYCRKFSELPTKKARMKASSLVNRITGATEWNYNIFYDTKKNILNERNN